MGKIQDDDSTRTNTSPTHKKPLTPTKDHPLMDLVKTKVPRGEFMDSDSDDTINMVIVEKDDAVVDCSELKHDVIDVDVNLNIDNNNIESSQISTPPSSQPAATESEQIITTSTQNNVDDEKNNNTRVDMNESDDEAEKQQNHQKLTVDKVVRRKKSPSRVNNNNIKNNNRMSYPMGRDRSQPSENLMTKSSTDKIDGKKNIKKNCEKKS